eukprot:CAMPEP_0172534002 /NCGR_PEP_ID=MMETSP1067-20121228/6518_1 /TAXON_ID=265564 ORGANISM="Thalassiosira punctigera, Strain Tpunct2005C2" /NCGR_SAMPLE_ID=MMETSP1067 /ASSEMBLY_ACC=CAM_ASM_000444 /LENGTH=271 /DNA_ID=CAMNT_0013318729 /DNA_START=256 /DNA_END=1068 /DNA_ORIENTATION=-
MSAYTSLPGSALPPWAPPSPVEKVDVALPNDYAQEPKFPTLETPSSNARTLSAKNGNERGFSPLSDAVVFRNARLSPVELVKSMPSKGSNLAPRRDDRIARTSETDCCMVSASDAHLEIESSSYELTFLSRPSLSYDDEYLMYDYIDDFSTPHDEEDDDEQESTLDDDRALMEFEMSICFRGRNYPATRSFPTFVKLREDLLREHEENKMLLKQASNKTNLPMSSGVKNDMLTTIPELPIVSPENLRQVAGSGFAQLQAMAQNYCPGMEVW